MISPPAIKIFDKRTFPKTEGIPYEIFRYCEKVNFRQNRGTTSYAIYLIRKFSEKEGPPRIFSVVWDKEVSRESRNISLLAIKNFDKRIFCENCRNPLQNFAVLWEKQFSTKSWYTFLCNFLNPETFWNKSVPYKTFWYYETKKFRDKTVIPLFCIKSFDTRNFLKHRIVLLQNFPALWDKKISTVNNDNPLLSFKISDTRNFLEDRESPYWNFRYCEKNNNLQNRDTSSYASFLIQKFSETKESPYYFPRYCKTKKCREKVVLSPP